MSMIFTPSGLRALRVVYGVTLAGIAVAAFLVAGSYWYWQAEKRDNQKSNSLQQESRTRLATAQRERDDLRDSEQTYKAITARGLFTPEQRLDWVEALAALKTRHQLVALEYEVQPQRPLKLSGNTSLAAVDVLGSRIKFKVRALHDGDLVAFLDEFPRMQRGFFPLDRCVIKRSAELDAAAKNGRASGTTTLGEADAVVSNNNQAAEPTLRANPDNMQDKASTALEAECSLEWITLADKRNPAAPASVSAARQK